MKEDFLHIDYKDWELDISYALEAAGDTSVICLHGLQSNKDVFAPAMQLCAEKNLTAVSIDFIGFGKSSKPKDFSYLLEDQAAVIDRVISQLRLKKLYLIGHSMGGMVGTMLLNDLEKQLLGFINMEGNFVLEDCGASLPASKATYEEFSKTLYPELLESLKTSPEPSAKQRRQWLLETTPDYAFHGAAKSIVEWSHSKKLIPLFVDSPVRKLFIYGENNRRKKDVFPSLIPSVEIPGAGHFMLGDNPKDTLKAIGDFLY